MRTERVLIVNVNWLGDVVFSTPAIRAIRDNLPRAFIACMAVPRAKGILEGNPNLDEIIVFDEDKMHRGLFAKLRFIRQLSRRKFDVAFLLHRSFTRTLIIFLAGIQERIGYYTKKRGFLLTRKVMQPEKNIHRAEYFLNLLKESGLKIKEKKICDFFISSQERQYINNLLHKEGVREDGAFIVVNPGGNWPPKRWPKENFARLSDGLIQNYHIKVIFTGAEKDSGLIEEILGLTRIKPVNICGRTTLKQLGALLEKAHLVVSNDSGPLHIAVALGKKVIALFGPTSPSITGPYTEEDQLVIQKDVGCGIPCYNVNCQNNKCMKAITVEDVLRAVETFRL